ncbi:MAG: glycoside hydrolase [Acidobacteriota bacterium]|nr:MAG: glycoside hydrolase [Acidobacteriota bacterium]
MSINLLCRFFVPVGFKALCLLIIPALLVAVQPPTVAQEGVDELARQFVDPPDESRIMMRWWWFGPAVTKERLEREMTLMKEGGIGGFEIQPVYPVALDDGKIRTLPYLSDEFLDALRFVNRRAGELGLRVDLTIGSGWPYGGPTVPVTMAAGRLRVEKVRAAGRRMPLPDISEGEKLITAFHRRGGQTLQSFRELTTIRDGAAWLPDEPQTGDEVLFFISGRTGMMVKRPAVGAEGFVLDHYDRRATDDYLKNVGDRLLRAFDGRPPYAVFCDSLEVFNSDWTGDYLEEFRKRRGYDLKPYLPALAAEIGPETRSIRHDWAMTLTEIFNDRFLAPMRDWSKANRTLFRMQGYGIPPMTLSGNEVVDLPEGEGPHWKVVRASRWAASASHLYGKPVTSSETWTWLHSPSFRATPLDVKAEADLHFLQGINQLIGHGWPYTAEGADYPGWRFYAAGVFNEKNPWWMVMPDLAKYLQRASFMLRQGRPANDIALYLPTHDAWADYSSGRVGYLIDRLRDRVGTDCMPEILGAGFNLDFIDDHALSSLARIDKNHLVMGVNRYRAVILPNVERIPLASLRKLESFVDQGGVVIATRRIPGLAPGFRVPEEERRQISSISSRLFEGPNARAHFVRDEKSLLGARLAALVKPDVAYSRPGTEFGFIRRSSESAEIYFITNTTASARGFDATFRVTEMNAEIWDPLTGSILPAPEVQRTPSGTQLKFELDPYGSRFVVFNRRSLPVTAVPASMAAEIDLSADWQMTIAGRRTTLPRLRSWAEDEETRYFSGSAVYEKRVNVPAGWLQKGNAVRLDFGEGKALEARELRNGMRAWLDAPVRDAAVIFVNGRRAGSVWCPPYAIDITKLLVAGENQIRIEVGNTAINHLAGHSLPDYRLLNLRYGERFKPQDMENLEPLPSGLLGPVRIVVR